MSMVNIVEWCAQFRARWGFSIIMYVTIIVCGPLIHVELVGTIYISIEQHDSFYFVHYSGISLLWSLLGQLRMS